MGKNYGAMMRQHVHDWESCTDCPLHAGRFRIVLGMGPTPSKVMVIGFHPGPQETTHGKPFVGMDGRLLRKAIHLALPGVPVFYTNILACPAAAGRNPPSINEIEACADRVYDLLTIHEPEALIFTSATAASHWIDRVQIPAIVISEFTRIARNGGQRGGTFHGIVSQVKEFWAEVCDGARAS